MKPKLEPCPFCGGKPIINHTLVWGSMVFCETCQARTSPGCTDEEAIKRWNTRHHSEELLDMVEGKE